MKYLPLVIEQRITTDPTEILPNIVGEYSYVCSSKSVNYLSKMTDVKDMTSYRQLVAIPLSIDGSPSPKSDFRFWDRLYDKYTNNLKITPDVMRLMMRH